MKKSENLDRQTSSKDSIKMNWPSAIAFYRLKDKGWELAASADLKVQSG